MAVMHKNLRNAGTILNAALANAVARSLNHLPGAWRDWGVMKSSTCQRCRAYAVERTDDGLGVTGPMTVEKCGGKK